MTDLTGKTNFDLGTGLTDEEIRRARLYVAGSAVDATEAHDFLDMLGLL